MEPSRPACDLCQDHHSHTSSPKEWKNENAQKYLQSLGMSLDWVVCHPCRQDVGQASADPAHTPRWERRRIRIKSCCYLANCHQLSIACATLRTTEFLNDIQFKTYPPPTPTPLCKHHYHAVYNLRQVRQDNCRTCGRRLRAGNDRHYPQPKVVEAYLREHTDFTMDISESDHVCFTCYKSHLEILKQNHPTSTDEDLRPLALVESVRVYVGIVWRSLPISRMRKK